MSRCSLAQKQLNVHDARGHFSVVLSAQRLQQQQQRQQLRRERVLCALRIQICFARCNSQGKWKRVCRE